MTIRAKLWTRDEYDRLVAAGAFRAESRVQLVRGEIVEMTPQSAAHAVAVELAQGALQAALGPGHFVRVQLPLALGEDSEPEPDLAVVAGPPRTRTSRHPATAVLVVEVADTTLDFDRTRKLEIAAQRQRAAPLRIRSTSPSKRAERPTATGSPATRNSRPTA